jgi:NTE family protein
MSSFGEKTHFRPDALACPVSRTMQPARVATRLKELDTDVQDQLIDWGYAVCNPALPRHVDRTAPAPNDFPYPSWDVG